MLFANVFNLPNDLQAGHKYFNELFVITFTKNFSVFKTVASFDLWLYGKSKSKPAAEVTIYLFGSSSSKLTYLSVFSTFTLVFQHLKVPNLSGSDFTVWKFHDFTVTQILREINFAESRSAKTAIFTIFGALNSDN